MMTQIAGIRVGHAENREALTGCTVILCEAGAVAAVDVRGAAPGTRETDLMRPGNLVERVHAILLTGGSAYGLAAADGVMRYLEERGVGFPVGVGVVPIVPAAVIFDLAVGDPAVRPDAALGYAACQAASDGPVAEGNVGAGCGATVGKILGQEMAMKGGQGCDTITLPDGVIVSALMVVNALGDVVDPVSGQIIAGARQPDGSFANAMSILLGGVAQTTSERLKAGANTSIGVVVTNADLTRSQALQVARMAHDGIARAIRPSHTLYDGDTIFVLATGERPGDPVTIGVAAAEVVAGAIVRGVRAARSVAGLPGVAGESPMNVHSPAYG